MRPGVLGPSGPGAPPLPSPPWGRPRRAPSVGGVLEAAALLPEATASASRSAGTLSAFAAGLPGAPAGGAAAVAGRRAAGEANHAACAWRMLGAQTARCPGWASGMALLLLGVLALHLQSPGALAFEEYRRPYSKRVAHRRVEIGTRAPAAPSLVGASGSRRRRDHVARRAAAGARLESVAFAAQGVPIGTRVHAVAIGVQQLDIPWLRVASTLVGGK